ncbi:MAG: ion transporter, partial [Bacteroidota bacterium]
MPERKSYKRPVRDRIHEIIFEADTPLGKFFDISLLVLIVLSVITVMLETVSGWSEEAVRIFVILEWAFTIIFTVEYLLRLWVTIYPLKYA